MNQKEKELTVQANLARPQGEIDSAPGTSWPSTVLIAKWLFPVLVHDWLVV